MEIINKHGDFSNIGSLWGGGQPTDENRPSVMYERRQIENYMKPYIRIRSKVQYWKFVFFIFFCKMLRNAVCGDEIKTAITCDFAPLNIYYAGNRDKKRKTAVIVISYIHIISLY